METLPKALVLFGFELCASVYIGIRVLGSVIEAAPPLGMYLSAGTSLLLGAALLAAVRGISEFSTERERTPARETVVTRRPN